MLLYVGCFDLLHTYMEPNSSGLASNYAPLPIEPQIAKGGMLFDAQGRGYVDAISGYGVTSAGHAHPKMIEALKKQLETGVLSPSRAVTIPRLNEWAERICKLTGFESVLPMVTGAEAVETAIKVMRKYAYKKRNVPDDDGIIIYAQGNFHGRTTTIVGMSSDPQYRGYFGPYPKGFVGVPFGDEEALRQTFSAHRGKVVMFLAEPVQAEGGMIVPPEGYWRKVRQLCDEFKVPLVLDEIQTGFGRTGKNFAFQHFGIRPDGIALGKYLGGGVPLSAFLASKEILSVIDPGDHGSTFGGNPLAVAGSLAAMDVLEEERLSEQAVTHGNALRTYVLELVQSGNTWAKGVRGVGLMLGIELVKGAPEGSVICRKLLKHGVVTNTAHAAIRLTPRLNLSVEELDLLKQGLAVALSKG